MALTAYKTNATPSVTPPMKGSRFNANGPIRLVFICIAVSIESGLVSSAQGL